MPESRISHYLCIGCPLGCRLEVEDDQAGDIIAVRGFGCKRGEAYGRQEHTDPRRVVATSVRIRGARWERLPVKTSGAIPKAMVRAAARAARGVEVEAPISLGTVVLANVLGSGVDFVATRDMERLAPR
jgi:CxxC motif-containing protein